jgi:hypothetical protein
LRLPDLSLGPEWAVLELLCRDVRQPEEREHLGELLRRPDLSWGELIEQALRQKMLPLLAWHVMAGEHGACLAKPIRRHLESVLDVNRHGIDLLRQEAARVVQALEAAGVPFVATKGITFESTLYGGTGSRPLLDIDFMIEPKNRQIVAVTMHRLGYETGLFDWQTGSVTPLSRRDMITHKLNPDHIPNLARPTGDPVIRHTYVDFANSLTWASSPYDVPVEDALATRCFQPIPGVEGVQLPCFSPEFQFVFTILHLFREAWFDRWLEIDQDVNLMKFGDLVRLWNRDRERLEKAELVEMLENYGIVGPAVWVLEHLDRTLHTSIVPALGLEGRVTEDWLASAYASAGALHRWYGTMRQRLHSKNRRALFKEAV